MSVAVDCSSNTESCLILVLLLAAWALLRAAEDDSRRWLLLSMALGRLAFNVKMLAAALLLSAGWQLYVDAHALGGVRDLLDDLAHEPQNRDDPLRPPPRRVT